MVSDFPFSLEKLTYIGNLMIFVQTNWFGMQHGSIKFGSTSDLDEIFIISLCIQAETPYCIQFSFVALFGTQKKKDKRISQEFRMLTLQEHYLFLLQGPVNFVCLHCVNPSLRPLSMAMCTVATHLFGDVPSSPLVGVLQVCLLWLCLWKCWRLVFCSDPRDSQFPFYWYQVWILLMPIQSVVVYL